MENSVFGRAGRWLVKAVLVLSLIGLVAGALGRFSTDLDVLANARVHFAGLAAAAALALWLNQRPVVMLLLGGFLTLAGHSLLAQQNEVPLIGAAQAEPAKDATAWTILSLNTWHKHQDPAGLSDALIASNADILVLTEFGPNKIPELHRLEKIYPYRVDCAGDWDCSVAVLSRHPFTASGSRPEGAGPAMAWLTFGIGANAMTIVGIEVAGPLGSSKLHARQLASLANSTSGFDGRVLVAGSFNATPWTNAFSSFELASGLEHMGRFLPSYPSGREGLPQLAIDHMFASPGIRFEEAWLGPDVGSDHRPLFARVGLPRTVVSALP